jgi:hypothetical protein
MKISLLIFICLSIFLTAPASIACSIVSNEKAQFKIFSKKNILPEPTNVSVDYLYRGGDMSGTCDDLAMLQVSIPIDRENPAFAYKFELVSGALPSDVLYEYAVKGLERGGKNVFIFLWLEYKPLPINVTLSVTAYSKSGKRGGTTLFKVSDSGL